MSCRAGMASLFREASRADSIILGLLLNSRAIVAANTGKEAVNNWFLGYLCRCRLRTRAVYEQSIISRSESKRAVQINKTEKDRAKSITSSVIGFKARSPVRDGGLKRFSVIGQVRVRCAELQASEHANSTIC